MKWLFAAYQIPSKVSVLELSEKLNRPYKTVYRIVAKLRRNLYLTAPTAKLGGIVEVDEAYVTVGRKRQKKHQETA